MMLFLHESKHAGPVSKYTVFASSKQGFGNKVQMIDTISTYSFTYVNYKPIQVKKRCLQFRNNFKLISLVLLFRF